MKKKNYQAPFTELYEIKFEGALLIGSVEGMDPITGSWEEEGSSVSIMPEELL